VRAELYCRVSTEEQGNRGYSLRQQLEALREYCQQNEYEIVGEFEDRVSGAYLHRPGLDTLRDLVADGDVDIVFAQDADLGEGLNIGFGTM
jgi:site-specific DNA recombinase